jgi:hypothetical protein
VNAEVESSLSLFLVALMQVADPAPSTKIDLTPSEACQKGVAEANEVVVCGRRGDGTSPYRIKEPTPPPDRVRAEAQLSDVVSAAAETENVDVGGRPSNRLMVRLKIKF